ncbi:MAG: PEP-CTERM sorting domain-containing protein [Deltaproteobacteria bacterium]|nr:PEP-CTERM sorting domain-containing protein [Deltaproteobacteria bacterium]MBW2419122.1 PEP-CTERM sorting domain-containing protein [Deltaproteobacteria bacterium]
MALVLPFSASAVSIVLSDMSSEDGEVPGTPASVLDAIVGFEIGEFDGGNAGDEIQLTLQNTTSGGPGAGDYDVSAFWVNLSSDITIGSILSPGAGANLGWELTAPPPDQLGGLGTFNLGVELIGDVNLNPDLIAPGETATILISFSCSGTCDDGDVINNLKDKAAAAKFRNGGNVNGDPNDSAFGASPVPEPTTAVLLALGLVGIGFARRRA